MGENPLAVRKDEKVSIDIFMRKSNSGKTTPVRFQTQFDGGLVNVVNDPHYKAKNGEEFIVVPHGSEYKVPELLVRAYMTNLYKNISNNG